MLLLLVLLLSLLVVAFLLLAGLTLCKSCSCLLGDLTGAEFIQDRIRIGMYLWPRGEHTAVLLSKVSAGPLMFTEHTGPQLNVSPEGQFGR